MPSTEDSGFELNRYRLGKAIAEFRRKAGLEYGVKYTQADMCEDLNEAFNAQMNVQKLSRIERGQKEPSVSLLVQISMLLGRHRWKSTLTTLLELSLSEELKLLDTRFVEQINEADMAAEELAIRKLGNMLAYFLRADPTLDDLTAAPSKDAVAVAFRDIADKVHETNTPIAYVRINEATPAPPQGAVAIDEPQGKEHDHEQD